jgi:hypothetical protein
MNMMTTFFVQQWEYKIDQFKNSLDPLGRLNEAGLEGWELVSVVESGVIIVCVYKRPLPKHVDVLKLNWQT